MLTITPRTTPRRWIATEPEAPFYLQVIGMLALAVLLGKR